jgi:hypothetical protein
MAGVVILLLDGNLPGSSPGQALGKVPVLVDDLVQELQGKIPVLLTHGLSPPSGCLDSNFADLPLFVRFTLSLLALPAPQKYNLPLLNLDDHPGPDGKSGLLQPLPPETQDGERPVVIIVPELSNRNPANGLDGTPD